MIKLVNVSKYYSGNDVIALGLRKVNLELHLNEFVAVIGESGSGKTTLLNVISGIDSYEEGEMYVNGKETSYFSVEDMENYRKKYIAFVFQNYNLIDAYTVLQNVEAPLILSGYPKEKIKERAIEIIKRVGLEKHIHQKATKLSGGQKQRVVIARALAKDCPIIAADEPTGNLDSESAKGIIELLHEISKEKLVIVVTHDFNQVKDYATRKIRIYDGEIVEDRNIQKTDKQDLPDIEDKDYEMKFGDLLKIALRNLLSVPKKTLLMIIVFSFFSMFVALAFGAYYVTISDETSSYNTHFLNTSQNRIVVKKTDNSIFTQSDLDQLKNLSKDVQVVMPFDYVLDSRGNAWTNNYIPHVNISSLNYLPIELITEDELDYGTMPGNDNQIVVAVNSESLDDAKALIGNTVYLGGGGFKDEYGVVPSSDDSETSGYIVSGVINKSKLITSGLSYYTSYFLMTSEAINKVRKDLYFTYTEDSYFDGQVTIDSKDISYRDSYKYSAYFVIDDSLTGDTMVESIYRANFDCSQVDSCEVLGKLVFKDSYVENTIDNVTVQYSDKIEDYALVYVSQDLYNKIFYDDIYQVSVLTNTTIDVKALFRSIQKLENASGEQKYDAIYPYDSQASTNIEALSLLMMNIGMISLIVIVLLGSTFITYVIFRAIINTKLHDYTIFRTIGANRKTIRYFIYLENLYIVIISFLIFLTISLSLPASITMDTGLFYALKVFNVWRYIIFFILEIIMSLIISRKYCNRIFKTTVNQTLKTNLG